MQNRLFHRYYGVYTGTPISNSMCELYTMQRYLQYDLLSQLGLQQFDAWASSFGETVTTIELVPEGTGYRPRTRFARFYNLPELLNLFCEAADIKTAEMLNLPTPKVQYKKVSLKPSEFQKGMVSELADRAEKIRSGQVDPRDDSMLKITNDGRKLALDQRLVNPLLPDDVDSKINACTENIFQLWETHKEQKLTQLVFCDISTPKNDGKFNVYDDLRRKLTTNGIFKEEIAFIHEAKTDIQKKELLKKVRSGQIRTSTKRRCSWTLRCRG